MFVIIVGMTIAHTRVLKGKVKEKLLQRHITPIYLL